MQLLAAMVHVAAPLRQLCQLWIWCRPRDEHRHERIGQEDTDDLPEHTSKQMEPRARRGRTDGGIDEMPVVVDTDSEEEASALGRSVEAAKRGPISQRENSSMTTGCLDLD